MEKKKWLEISAIIGSCCSSLLFGLSYLFTKRVIGGVPTYTLLSWRFSFAALALLFCVLVGIIKVDYRGKPLRLLALIALFNPFLYFTCETFGMRYITVSEVSTIVACTPIITMLLSFFFLREVPRRVQIIGASFATVGMLLFAAAKGMSPSFDLRGYLFMIGAVVCNAAYYTVSRKAAAKFSPIERTLAMCVTGAIVFMGIALAQNAGQGQLTEFLTLPLRDHNFLLSAAYLGIGCSCTALLLSNRSISIIGPTRSCTFAALSTIISVVSGVLLMHDSFSLLQGAGTAIAIAGIYLVNSTPAVPIDPKYREK
ncbi:MAG: DMT family transporter [Clostridia bacterium]|nr:DMT family transporter [Clostridia bacterium]